VSTRPGITTPLRASITSAPGALAVSAGPTAAMMSSHEDVAVGQIAELGIDRDDVAALD
jgi:hypothetical protein